MTIDIIDILLFLGLIATMVSVSALLVAIVQGAFDDGSGIPPHGDRYPHRSDEGVFESRG